MSKSYAKMNKDRFASTHSANRGASASATRAKTEPNPQGRGGASLRPQDEPVVERKSLPAWTWLIFGVVLGFGLARWTEDGASAPAVALAAQPVQVVKPSVAATADSNVDINADRTRYDFYNLLPEQEVTTDKVEEYKSTPRDDETAPEYILQVGSFKTNAEADQFADKLKAMGFTSQISSVVAESGTEWHRVRIGPFQDRRKLNKAQDQLAKQNIQSLLIRLPK